jgi:hypothetical protein
MRRLGVLFVLLAVPAFARPVAVVVSGRVVREDGSPVGKVAVTLREERDFDHDVLGSTTTRSDGTFHLVLREVYRAHRCADHGFVRAGDGVRGGESDPIRLGSGGQAWVGDLVLRECQTVRGRVVDEDGAPIPDATVRLLEEDCGDFRPRCAAALTDERGEFRFPGLPPRPGRALWVRAVRRGLLPGEAPLPRPLPDDPARVVLRRGRTVTGRLVYDDGAPAGLVEGTFESADASVRFQADREGGFEVAGVPCAGVTLGIRRTSLRQTPIVDCRLEVPAGERGGTVDLGEVTVVRSPDAPAGILSGMLLDGSGRPCGGVRVTAAPVDYPRLTYRCFGEPGGRFTVACALPGRVTLTATRHLDLGDRQVIEAGPVEHDAEGIEIRFPDDGLVVLRLRGKVPPEGLVLFVDGEARARVWDAERPLRFLPGPGRHAVRLAWKGRTVAEARDLEVSPEGVTECELRLQAR